MLQLAFCVLLAAGPAAEPVKVDVEYLAARLRAPFVSASGSIGERALVLLRLEDSAGRVGFGEAAPLPDYNGVSVDDVREALEGCRTTLVRAARLAPRGAAGAVHRARGAAARGRGDRPGAVGSRGPADRTADLAAARRARRRAGRGQLHDRRRRSRRRRRAGERGQGGRAFAASRRRSGSATTPAGWPRSGPCSGRDVAIRLDANGAWSVEEAVAALRVLAPVGIELCEEPVRGLAQTRALVGRDERADRARRDRVGDRSARDARLPGGVPEDRRAAAGSPACVDAARQARAAGYEVYLASTLDGPLGIAAALHVAAVVRPDRACWPGDAGSVRRPQGSAAGARRSDRGTGGRRPRRRPALLVSRRLIGAHVTEVTHGPLRQRVQA